MDVIKNERPDLEARKDKLVVSIANDQKQPRDTRSRSSACWPTPAAILTTAHQPLALSKTTSTVINGCLTEAEGDDEINETREGYRAVATRGSVIYFVVATGLVDPMYQYSLQFYNPGGDPPREDGEEGRCGRASGPVDRRHRPASTDRVRLFEKDKLPFAFMVAVKIARAAVVTEEE